MCHCLVISEKCHLLCVKRKNQLQLQHKYTQTISVNIFKQIIYYVKQQLGETICLKTFKENLCNKQYFFYTFKKFCRTL